MIQVLYFIHAILIFSAKKQPFVGFRFILEGKAEGIN